MQLIDKIIKILINFKYKRDPFMEWSWGLDDKHEISILSLSTEYYNDHCRYGTREEHYLSLKVWKEVLEQEPILDKIRNEIEQIVNYYDEFDDYRRKRGLWIALDIIDKYKHKSEDNNDKK